MRQISKKPILLKWVFPLFWFGLLGLVTVAGIAEGRTHPMAIIMPVLMAAIGFVIMKKFVWDLADEVLDGGDFLVIRKGGLKQKVYLSDIINIEHMGLSSPPRITLLCRTPGPLGTELAFVAPLAFNPFFQAETGSGANRSRRSSEAKLNRFPKG